MVELFESVVAAPSKRKRKNLDLREVSQHDSNATDSPNRASPNPGSDLEEDEPGFSAASNGTANYRSRKNLKVHHVGVLNTIMHVCMRKGDYARAGRAFATVLRLEINTRRLDLRHNGLWGLGAELLLREYKSRPIRVSSVGQNNDTGLEFNRQGGNWVLTSPVFETAKAYYERLILQYPHRSVRPDDVCSLDFFPAMFAFWILQVQVAVNENKSLPSQTASSEPENLEDFSKRSETHGSRLVILKNPTLSIDKQRPNEKLLEYEYSQAHRILERLSAMIHFPPFDRDVKLRNLFGMVNLWIYDLGMLYQSDPNEIHRYHQAANEAFEQVRHLRNRL